MESIRGHHVGRQVLAGDVAFHGLLDGDLVVPEGIHLILRGTVNGNVIVEEGGSADIRGMVNGAVVNNGGDVSIYGAVESVTGTHASHLDPHAVVQH
ncbi:hypothetical protein [Methylobacterium nigriterrae]|uniref:hypothetical protein n=1 Tax=Methylobacterium nigriterrae TaxID=3127512 RepID=UPI003013585D